MSSPEGEQIFKPYPPRLTGVSGLNLVSDVGSFRPEGKHMFVLATPWRCGRGEEFDNRSRCDQGQGNIQHCHHASALAQPVPSPVFPFTRSAVRWDCPFFPKLVPRQDNRSGEDVPWPTSVSAQAHPHLVQTLFVCQALCTAMPRWIAALEGPWVQDIRTGLHGDQEKHCRARNTSIPQKSFRSCWKVAMLARIWRAAVPGRQSPATHPILRAGAGFAFLRWSNAPGANRSRDAPALPAAPGRNGRSGAFFI